MVTASELRTGMGLRMEGRVYKVLEVEARSGTAQMSGSVNARLSNVRSGRIWDQHFRPLEKLDNVELDKHRIEFLYAEGENCVFQRLDSYEQIEFPIEALGMAARFLESGAEVTAEFFGEEAIGLDLPDTVEARVRETAAPARSQPDSGRKEAVLENGFRVQVPLFVGPGETVRVDLKTGRYVERIRAQHRKSA